jgi:hypothetical protein
MNTLLEVEERLSEQESLSDLSDKENWENY